MRIRHAIVALSLAVGLAGCGGNKTVGFRASPRAVTLEVEVYDPDTNLVWEGVSVRIVEAEHEWSGVIVENPIADDWFLTSNTGTVYYSARDLAETSIGFLESDRGDAIIEPERDADEAFVLVELAAKDFPTVRVEASVRWDEPDVFLSVPYSPLP